LSFTLRSPSDMSPLAAGDDALAIALAAPRPWVASNALTAHLDQAMGWVGVDMLLRDHVQAGSGRDFHCLSYYADDPDVTACCAAHDGTFLATLGIDFVHRMVVASQRIADAVLPFDLSATAPAAERPPARADRTLLQLLHDDAPVPTDWVTRAVAAWPDARTRGLQTRLGGFALFYDLLRLVWLHEWAHALCGHATFAREQLGLARLHEFSAERMADATDAVSGLPRHEVMQALEMHADEFALRYCVGEITAGNDPVAEIAGPRIDLLERLSIFNLACCVFAVMWSSAEQRLLPELTFYLPRAQRERGEGPHFVPYRSSHPPAALRYLRFRNLQRNLLEAWSGSEPRAAALRSSVDAHSFLMLNDLAGLDPSFADLKKNTPGVAATPETDLLADYEEHLVSIGGALAPALCECGFLPREMMGS
jgi:hypothetical protein